jgi:glucokinase
MSKSLVIGIDIGGTNTKMGLVDRTGKVSEFLSFPTQKSFQEWLTYIKPIINHWITNFYIKGIGIGAPNGNHQTQKIENPVNLPWEEVKIVEIFNQEFQLPTHVDNDANLAALAEKYFGVAQNCQNFFVVTLGTGFGSGIFVHDKVLRGAHGIGGEAGHMCLYPNGRKCSCGGLGHLEAYVSIRGIEETYFELNQKKLNVNEILELWKNRDQSIYSTVQTTAKHFALGLCQMINLFDPEIIIVSGGISHLGQEFIDMTWKELHPLLTLSQYRPELIISEPGKNYGAIQGASILIYENHH